MTTSLIKVIIANYVSYVSLELGVRLTLLWSVLQGGHDLGNIYQKVNST